MWLGHVGACDRTSQHQENFISLSGTVKVSSHRFLALEWKQSHLGTLPVGSTWCAPAARIGREECRQAHITSTFPPSPALVGKGSFQAVTSWQALRVHAKYIEVRNAYPDVNSPPSLPSLSLYLRREIRCSSPLEERTHARPYQPAAQCHLKSRLLQACGVVAGTPCGHCARGFGRWEACIVNDPHSADDPLHGSCANCFYSGQSKRCSLRQSLSRAIIKNDKAATLDDVLSRTFPDLESAEQALNGHLQPNGFRMARRVSNRNATGDFISRHYACVRYQWLKSPLQNHLCPWRITIKRKDDFWVVASPRGEHNHPPVDHYNPKEKWRCPVSQCKRVMPMSEKETHICGPPLANCWRCGLRLLKSEQAAHLKICKWYRCSKCRKHGILRTEKEKHSQECTGQQSFSCNRCRKSFANLQEHYKVCEYWKCPRCRKEKILASEKLEHAKACSKLLPAVCRKCAKYGTHQYI